MKRHLVVAGRQRGVSLITAIFLLVVLAGMGVALLTVSTSQQITSAMDVQGARAYQAARAGIEWGLYRQRWAASDPCASEFPASFPMPAGTSLSGFNVTVQCTITSLSAIKRHRMIATACNQPKSNGSCPNPSSSSDYVQRRVQVEFGDMK